MAAIAHTIVFFEACVEARGPPDIQDLYPYSHPVAPLLNHADTHGVPISLPWGMTRPKNKGALQYCAYASASKEGDCVHQELEDQVKAVHISVLPLDTVSHLHKLWLSPLAFTPQQNIRPKMIYNFAWSNLNATTTCLAPQ